MAVTPDIVEEREFQAEGRACSEAQDGGRKGDQSAESRRRLERFLGLEEQDEA